MPRILAKSLLLALLAVAGALPAAARWIVYDVSNDGWYALDGDYPYLALLRAAMRLRRARLGSGRAAWAPTR